MNGDVCMLLLFKVILDFVKLGLGTWVYKIHFDSYTFEAATSKIDLAKDAKLI